MVQLLALSRRRRRNWNRPKAGIERRKGEEGGRWKGTKLKWVKEKQLEQEKHLGLRGERRRRVDECEVRGKRREESTNVKQEGRKRKYECRIQRRCGGSN